jgi:polysaccharide export outer membrane protein
LKSHYTLRSTLSFRFAELRRSAPQALRFTLLLLLLSSCVTTRKLTYLQYTGEQSKLVKTDIPMEYTVLPYDNLFIRVITPDPQWSAMFNTMPVATSAVSVTEQSADLLSYPVDGQGFIELPYAGKIKVAGKTLSTITSEVEKALKGYVADAAVTVKMVNNYVNVIGEVQRPGRYPVYKERLNIFQALAMAGDLNEFSNRQKIQLIRQTNEGTMVKEFTLTDRSILTSEFFYVMPNDVIYAPPMKGKFFHMNEFPYSVLLSTITTFLLMWNVLKL